MSSHIQVFNTKLVEIVIHTPADAIHIVLHCQTNRNSMLFYAANSF